jgi:isopenicillin N synthase-like dioxygenase
MLKKSTWKYFSLFTALCSSALNVSFAEEASALQNNIVLDSSIPVLDMRDYQNLERRPIFMEKLSNALKEVGFFAILHPGVDPKILDLAYDRAKEFFQLDQVTKRKIFHPELNGQRGYIPGESAKGASIGDFKEFLHIGRELPEIDLARLGMLRNIWPEEVSLKEPLTSLYTSLEEHFRPLEEAISTLLGKPADYLSSMTKESVTLLRAIHYFQSPPSEAYWASPHTDINLITILPRATAEGLQVKNKNGEWIDVVVPDGAFIVNSGDMLENLTNGMYRSGPHRVLAKHDGYERFSMVLFIHPRPTVRLDPLPECIEKTGGVRKYADATAFELLSERLVDLGLASRPLMEGLVNSGLMERLIEVGRASPKAMQKLKEEGLASDAMLLELEKLKKISN